MTEHARICKQIKNNGFWNMAMRTYRTKEAKLMRWRFAYLMISSEAFLIFRKHQERKHVRAN